MGARKRIQAEQSKEANKTTSFAKLNNCPTSPRKMRLVADMVRGKDVETALNILTYTPQAAATPLKKLLLTAIASWEQKSKDTENTVSDLYIKNIMVDQSKTLKRIQPRAQGRAFRVRKRANHVSLYIDAKQTVEQKQI